MGSQLNNRPSASTAAAAPLAAFGIDNSGLGTAVWLLIIFLVAIWLALVFWTYSDARRRLTDPVLVMSAVIAALIFPFAGALIYAIVRPPETLDDAYERELDVRAAELRVRLLETAVKGGPGSSAQSAAVAAEVSGEPTGRRGSTPPPSSGSSSGSGPSSSGSRPESGRRPESREASRESRPSQPRPSKDAPRDAGSGRAPSRRPSAPGTEGA